MLFFSVVQHKKITLLFFVDRYTQEDLIYENWLKGSTLAHLSPLDVAMIVDKELCEKWFQKSHNLAGCKSYRYGGEYSILKFR